MRRRLGVNIDHIATLRQARGTRYPDPIASLPILKSCHVDQVTLHLREDRRHIKDDDLARVIAAKALPVNLEMAVTGEMVKIAGRLKPGTCTFVPEKRREITTEGGLDCVRGSARVGRAVEKLKKCGIRVSLFIDPDSKQLRESARLSVDAVELHTGTYCDELERFAARHATDAWIRHRAGARVRRAYAALREAASLGDALGLKVFAGHGLHAHNLAPVVRIPQIEEYNIGHAIIARAVFTGLAGAIREIQQALR